MWVIRKVFVLDEPTAALADTDIDLVHQAMRRLAASGKFVLYITHRLNELTEVCDEAVVLRNGKMVDRFLTRDTSLPRVVHAMIGRELDELYPPITVTPDIQSPSVLTLEKVTTNALSEQLTLRIPSGEIVATCGQLGSGYVEPLRASADSSLLESGKVVFADEEVDWRSSNRRKAYCSEDRQRDGFFPGLPVWESLSAPKLAASGLWGAVSPANLRNSVEEIADRMTILPSYRDRPVNELSGGNAQKVSIGKWLSLHPQLLLVEEPTRGVDVGARAEIYALLRDMANKGMAILFASSDLDEVLGFGQRVLAFHKNKMVVEEQSKKLSREALASWITHGTSTNE